MADKKQETKALPKHIAIIMDGNGRWAKQRGLDRVFGHQEGANAVRRVVETCGKIGIPYLTLYAFSTENWNRPKAEVDALMSLLVQAIHGEIQNLNDNHVRLNAIGNLYDLPENCRLELENAIRTLSANKGLTLTLSLSYSGRSELTAATKKIAEKIESGQLKSDEITAQIIQDNLYTADMPDPDILIRTGGEFRISNFLLWQCAYSEFFFVPCMWPDFSGEQLQEIISQYQNRERRFGKTSEQITNSTE